MNEWRAPASRLVTVDGCRLEYQWYGPPPGDAPTIVFLHEGLGAITRWRDFPAAVCEGLGWGGLVYNRQGYGGSDPLPEPLTSSFMHHEALDVLPRVIDALEVQQPVLFGHSDGGSIALIYAAARRVRALILEAAHVFVEPVTVASIAALREVYRSSGLQTRLARHHGPHVDTLFDAWTQVWLSDEFRGWNIERCLRDVTSPTLVIQGKDDEYGTLKQVDAMVGALVAPVETLILDACGHSPHLDQRAAVETATVRFLKRVARAAATHGDDM